MRTGLRPGAEGHKTGDGAVRIYPHQSGQTRPGGAYDYIIHQQGKVYQKDFGPNTGAIARKMKDHDPDSNWSLSID